MNNFTVKKHFDFLAPFYDQYKKKNSYYYSILKRAIKENIAKRGGVVLDVGCATGELLSFLHPKKGVGVDLSAKMIEIAKYKFASDKSLSFEALDIQRSFVGGRYDYILLNDVIEHLTDPKSALKNIAKSMTPETILILSMANPFWEPVLMILEKLHLKMPEGEHQRISERELKGILRQNGLKVIRKKTYLPSFQIDMLNNFSLIFVYQIKKEDKT